jgi:beta-galactosidase
VGFDEGAVRALLLVVVVLWGAAGARAEFRTANAPLLGSAWYPEQWPEAVWEHDLALMEAAHMNVVRIGEFAWSSEEPSEGHYELDWLARAIALAAKHHIAVVMGTPTDAPPAWLTTKYPDTLGTDANGRVREHGGRRQFSYASLRYRELCAGIVRVLAQRFGHDPNIIGWQIGNEYTDESFDRGTRAQFQEFLRAKYGTLAELNARWSTAYWSQSYDRWDEIPMEAANGNPGLLLEHKHFVTATWRSFQRNQIDVLRPLILAGQFITTNIGGLAWSDNWDHYAMTADLDIAAWDEYVGQGHLDAAKEAMLNDFVRGWKRRNFWVMETQPGSVNWAPVNNALWPGETRALAWQAVGHGADAILYWQWRAALNGQEQYHGAIVGPDGEPLPIYTEVQKLGADFALARAALAGASPKAEMALLYTYDSRWAIDFEMHTRRYDQQQVLLRFYEPLERLAQSRGEQLDVVDPTQAGDLSGYRVLVAPSLNVIDEALAAKLLAWVGGGGHLILGPRSGMKDGYDALDPHRQPGPLAAALGAKVEQYYALDRPVELHGEGMSGRGDIWAETLEIADAVTKATLTYGSGDWLVGKPAAVSRKVEGGTLSYLGTLPDEKVLAAMLVGSERSGAYDVPRDVELCARGKVFVAINHGAEERSFEMPWMAKDLLEPERAPSKSVRLAAQGVAVLVEEGK